MAHPDRFLLAGVMGWPVMHCRSPMLHNYWFRQHDLAGTCVPRAIRPEGLAAAMRALHPLGFAGCNLTIPHKQQAMTIVDEVDTVAKRIGAISPPAAWMTRLRQIDPRQFVARQHTAFHLPISRG